MSLDLFVYLKNKRLPTRDDWQAAIDASDVKLTLSDFDTRTFEDYVTCHLDGAECSFGYCFGLIEEDDETVADAIRGRDRVVTFNPGRGSQDLKAAMYAAAALTELSGGVFHDPQTGESAKARGVYELIRRDKEAECTRSRVEAAKDAAITNERCPHCGAPCPSYRKTCKACNRPVR